MLESYLVLDFTDERGEVGPMMLGDLGADVIRVETPTGSRARSQYPHAEGFSDDLRSLQFQAYNRNKRSIVLSPDAEVDRQVLESLLQRAHFVFESSPAGGLASFGLGYAEVQALNPSVVFVELSPFGRQGPHADLKGNDLVIAAMGGPVALQGVPERAPVRLSVPQVWRHAGAEAAVAALVAHTLRVRTGEGQYVDLSAQATMTWTLLNAMDAKAIQGREFTRSGGIVNTGAMAAQLVYATADGYLVALPHARTIVGCMEWMIEDGVADPALKELDWQEYDLNMQNPHAEGFTIKDGIELCSRFFALHNKAELFEFGLKHGLSLAPVNTLSELLALEHLQVREFWQDQAGIRTPGLWAKPSCSDLLWRGDAPALGEHTAAIRAQVDEAPGMSDTWGGERNVLPFAGIKVADFSWVGVGPISAKCLADHGAQVVRVESESRPDVLRAAGPFKDGEPGWNRSQFFGDFNSSKQSLTLDMKNSESLALARRLILDSDVLIESFAPGAIARMGLSYAELSKEHPGLIMISTCLMGQTGPAAGLAGYGYHAGAIAGFYEVTGWPDLGPNGPWIAYTDTIAPRFVATVLMAALDHRRRTGKGCYIDVAQMETALQFLSPELMDLQLSGHEATRNGNRSRYHAPQGCYPCQGDDQWCAVAVETEDEWQALCRTIGQTYWCTEERLSSHAARLAAHDEIDDAIASWTRTRSPREVMHTLQQAGVPAGVVQRSGDLLADPQYEYREFYRWFDHPEMGHIPYAGHAYRIAGYDNGPRGPAPCLGQHSFEILSEQLGLSDEEVAAAYAAGAVN